MYLLPQSAIVGKARVDDMNLVLEAKQLAFDSPPHRQHLRSDNNDPSCTLAERNIHASH
jgi:hypothetical protein